jgi:hypothetical protein
MNLHVLRDQAEKIRQDAEAVLLAVDEAQGEHRKLDREEIVHRLHMIQHEAAKASLETYEPTSRT